MDRNAVVAALAPALLLYACDRAVAPADDPKASGPPVPAELPSSRSESRSGVADDLLPDPGPSKLTPDAERSVKGARNVLLSFARAIELEEFDRAWALLSPADRQKWTKAEFARNFAGLEAITVAIPNGTTDGAAGSIYYLAPITIDATGSDGRPVRFEGETVLKRVNDVDGATPEQLRWHFDRLTLDWTH